VVVLPNKHDEDIYEMLSEKAKEFMKESDKSELDAAWKNHAEFIKRYPFREHPELIDKLTPDSVYKKGAEDYFFLWVEHKTKDLGAIFTYGGLVYPNAVANLDKFKKLLKIAVDDTKPLRKKIDAPWEEIKGFGGDKLIAKKIIFLYYPDKVVPIFNTDHLERIIESLGIGEEELERRAKESYGKEYDNLTLGERYELLNGILLDLKNSVKELKDWDNVYFMRFLYSICPDLKRSIKRSRPNIIPLLPRGALFSPVDELGVACLFFMYHDKLGFLYIVKVSNKFPDVKAIDENGELVSIELEYRASDFIDHNHPSEECDYIVCWENDLKEKPVIKFPRIISLKDKIMSSINKEEGEAKKE
jgi:hypothetical protein